MVICQYCNHEIEDSDDAEELTGTDGSTDGWMHTSCANKYLEEQRNQSPICKICNNVKGETCDTWGHPCPYNTRRKPNTTELPEA